MTIFLIAGAIAGMVLGLRFRSLVLVPASLFAIAAVIVATCGDRPGTIALAAIGTTASLQIGYLVSSTLRAVLDLATSASARSRSESTHGNVGYDY